MDTMELRRDAPASQPAFAEMQDVGIIYPSGIEALRDVRFSLARGEFVSLVGPSGCGKSTLLKAMAGLVPLSGGSQRIGAGAEAADVPRIAFVFQEPTLMSWRTVAANVRLPLELLGEDPRANRDHIREVLEWVGLEPFADAYPPQLSGGMQMRVSLARALVTRPDLLLLDEPFGALDDITRQRLNEDLMTLWLRDRWNGLFVTHNVAEAVYLGQRVLVMSDRPGTLAAEVDVTLAYPRPAAIRTTPAFNRLVGQVNDLLAAAMRGG